MKNWSFKGTCFPHLLWLNLSNSFEYLFSCDFYNKWEVKYLLFHLSRPQPGNTKGGSITVPLTSCLTGLDWSVWQIKTIIVICHTADSIAVKQEVNSTGILPPFRIPCLCPHPQMWDVASTTKKKKVLWQLTTSFASGSWQLQHSVINKAENVILFLISEKYLR